MSSTPKNWPVAFLPSDLREGLTIKGFLLGYDKS